MAIPETSSFELFLYEHLSTELLSYLLSFIDVDALMILNGVSTITRAIVHQYCRQEWDIKNFLKSWFPNPRAFVDILHRSGAVVGGSQPLQFFHRVTYKNTNFDIYTRVGGVMPIARWLIEDCAYHYSFQSSFHGKIDAFLDGLDPSKDDPYMYSPTGPSGKIAAYDFYKCRFGPAGILTTKWIRMWVVDVDPIHHIIHCSPSSTCRL